MFTGIGLHEVSLAVDGGVQLPLQLLLRPHPITATRTHQRMKQLRKTKKREKTNKKERTTKVTSSLSLIESLTVLIALPPPSGSYPHHPVFK